MNDKDIRIVLVYRRSRLQMLIERHNTLEQARFHVQSQGGDFDDYVREDRMQNQVLQTARQILQTRGRLQVLERRLLPNYLFGPHDRVVAVGQDGLVANTIKYLDGHALIAINPDPKRYEGVLLPFVIQDLAAIIDEVINGQRPDSRISLAEARLSDGQALLAVNDFFIGPSRHTTASYVLELGGRKEAQMSSGVIVSTGLGNTGWFRSIINGARGIMEQVAEQPLQTATQQWRQTWDDPNLLFVVREPYAPNPDALKLLLGTVPQGQCLSLESTMGEEGVIFSDGMLDDALAFRAGVTARISLAEKQGRLVL